MIRAIFTIPTLTQKKFLAPPVLHLRRSQFRDIHVYIDDCKVFVRMLMNPIELGLVAVLVLFLITFFRQ